ncbi:SPBc2 prophage-derived protein YolB [Bacillus sp. 5B6]|nr:SPBc2 prophage-derived protein YolB [Bacillus sp. 5B6]
MNLKMRSRTEKWLIIKTLKALNHQFDYWKSRITGGRAVTETDNQVLDIIKQAYNLGMVAKDNMLLRNQAINAYKTSI